MQARANAYTADEKVIEVELSSAVKELGDVISRELGTGSSPEQRSKESGQKIREFARQVATNSQRLRTINDQLIIDARKELAGTHRVVLLIRMLMLLLGPLLGIYLGWLVTRRLQSSVSEIAVTLNELTEENASQALRVSITKESSIEDVRIQAERVVDRLRQVGTELQSARKEVIRS